MAALAAALAAQFRSERPFRFAFWAADDLHDDALVIGRWALDDVRAKVVGLLPESMAAVAALARFRGLSQAQPDTHNR